MPGLAEFGVRPARPHRGLEALKRATVDALVARERRRGLSDWLVAWQTAPGSGLAHLDILLVYSRPVMNRLDWYDYLGRHGDLTRYRTVNAAILDYGRKEDPAPLGDLDATSVITAASVRRDLYSMMRDAMLDDPFEFNPQAWLASAKIDEEAMRVNVFKCIRMVRAQQVVECNRRLRESPSFPAITRELIESRLSAAELALFDSWPGYAAIVGHLNQIPRWGCRRPPKTPNLYLWGPSNTGKTTLLRAIRAAAPTYPFGVNRWWPRFETGAYRCITWNEFRLSVMHYTNLLQLLEGEPMDLEYKGGSSLKTCNPLVVMTSNLSPAMHLGAKFSWNSAMHEAALSNFAARVTAIRVGESTPLFILVKLIRPRVSGGAVSSSPRRPGLSS